MTPPAKIRTIYLKLAPPDIALVKFLFESYESVAIVRTIDRKAAIITVLVVEDFMADARAIVDELKAQSVCTELDTAPMETDDWLMRELDET